MLALPLNSVINPLIYDKKLRISVLGKLQQLFTNISKCAIIVSLQQRWQMRKVRDDAKMELRKIDNPPLGMQNITELAECRVVVHKIRARERIDKAEEDHNTALNTFEIDEDKNEINEDIRPHE
jgi:hypothetical protein